MATPEGLNRVFLLGNLGADPELRVTSGGAAVLKMRLATSESYVDRNNERKERTEWHNVVVWGRRAEALSKFLSKGARLFVEGGLRTSSYEDREGQKRYRTEIVASKIILAGSKREARREEEPAGQAADDYGDAGEDDDLPF